jgi:hypothetical protein
MGSDRASAWQAARAEVNQERESKQRDEADLPSEVVDRMVQEADVVIVPEADVAS